MKAIITQEPLSQPLHGIDILTPSRVSQLKRIRSSSCWDRLMDRTMSYHQVNVSHYGSKHMRMRDGLSSARTIDKTQRYEDEGDFAKPQGLRVNPRMYSQTRTIFDNVVSKSVDTDRKVTGCARAHFNRNNQSAFKLHYNDDELDTTQKVWNQK